MTPPSEWAAMEILPEKRRLCFRNSVTMRFISAATSSRITWKGRGREGKVVMGAQTTVWSKLVYDG